MADDLEEKEVRIKKENDALIIEVFSADKWKKGKGLLVFMLFWLFGIFMVSRVILNDPEAPKYFMLIWLFGWVFGAGYGISGFFWELFKLEKITLNKRYLKIERKLLGLSYEKEYDINLVSRVSCCLNPAFHAFAELLSLIGEINRNEMERSHIGEMRFTYEDKIVKFAENIKIEVGYSILDEINKGGFLNDDLIPNKKTSAFIFEKRLNEGVKNNQVDIREDSGTLIIEISSERNWGAIAICFIMWCFVFYFFPNFTRLFFLDFWIDYISSFSFAIVSFLPSFVFSVLFLWLLKGMKRIVLDEKLLRIEWVVFGLGLKRKYNVDLVENLAYFYEPEFNKKGEAKNYETSEGGGMFRFDYENKIIAFAGNITKTDSLLILEKMKQIGYLNESNFTTE